MPLVWMKNSNAVGPAALIREKIGKGVLTFDAPTPQVVLGKNVIYLDRRSGFPCQLKPGFEIGFSCGTAELVIGFIPAKRGATNILSLRDKDWSWAK